MENNRMALLLLLSLMLLTGCNINEEITNNDCGKVTKVTAGTSTFNSELVMKSDITDNEYRLGIDPAKARSMQKGNTIKVSHGENMKLISFEFVKSCIIEDKQKIKGDYNVPSI